MFDRDPKWLGYLSRRLKWLAIPNIAAILVTLQVIGFIFIYTDPAWLFRLSLIPEAVLQGQVWRVISYLAIPLSQNLIFLAIALWFEYFIVNSIESEWGAFKTTFYILISVALTAVFSIAFGYPVLSSSDFVSSLFLAAAALFPNFEIQIYFILPVKMKYLGWLTLAYLAWRLFQGAWIDRLFLLAIYSNYVIFFGPSLLHQIKEWKRRRDFKSKWR